MAGVYAKLGRAESHAKTLDATFEEMLRDNPYSLASQLEPDGWNMLVWKAANPELDFSPLALIYGDVLTNLRASLDYLVWQLVLANGATPVDRHAFPCVKKATDWASAAGDRLKSIAPNWVAEIRRLQPFNASDRDQPVERHLLAVLDRINNINKHRALPAVLISLESFDYMFTFPGYHPPGTQLEQQVAIDPIRHNAPAYRFRFTPKIEFNMDMDTQPKIRIFFDDGLARPDGWFYTTWDLIEWVRQAVTTFEPAFIR